MCRLINLSRLYLNMIFLYKTVSLHFIALCEKCLSLRSCISHTTYVEGNAILLIFWHTCSTMHRHHSVCWVCSCYLFTHCHSQPHGMRSVNSSGNCTRTRLFDSGMHSCWCKLTISLPGMIFIYYIYSTGLCNESVPDNLVNINQIIPTSTNSIQSTCCWEIKDRLRMATGPLEMTLLDSKFIFCKIRYFSVAIM